jgi:Uma2 family endonuclease
MATSTENQTDLESLRRELRLARAEQRAVLDRIQWDTFERLLADRGDRSAPRLAYSGGTIEIMSPSEEREEFNRALARFAEILCEEAEVEWRNLGSLTLKRDDLSRAVEPDSCFYIQNEPRVRRKKIDLTVDPPPDLVVEIDLTSSSLDRFPIYAALGVPEIWRYTGRAFGTPILMGGQYADAERSLAFPFLAA